MARTGLFVKKLLRSGSWGDTVGLVDDLVLWGNSHINGGINSVSVKLVDL